MATNGGENPFDNQGWEDDLYDQYPRGADHQYGPAQGYNIYRRLNDESRRANT